MPVDLRAGSSRRSGPGPARSRPRRPVRSRPPASGTACPPAASQMMILLSSPPGDHLAAVGGEGYAVDLLVVARQSLQARAACQVPDLDRLVRPCRRQARAVARDRQPTYRLGMPAEPSHSLLALAMSRPRSSRSPAADSGLAVRRADPTQRTAHRPRAEGLDQQHFQPASRVRPSRHELHLVRPASRRDQHHRPSGVTPPVI